MRAGNRAGRTGRIALAAFVAGALGAATAAQVAGDQKISSEAGGFTGSLGDDDEFGAAIAVLDDLDGNGARDVLVGVPKDDDGGEDRGAVFVLFLDVDGTVLAHQKISSTSGAFAGNLGNGDQFGTSVASLGDLDGDGVTDVAVGAQFDDDGGQNRGCVWILFLMADGTVKSHAKISDTEGAFTGVLGNGDTFGYSVARVPDLDGDAVDDLAVGARLDDDGGSSKGAVWVLFLNSDGSVKAHQKISALAGGFTGALDSSDFFGAAVVAIGDLDGDGLTDLAVGANSDDDGGTNRGAVWILNLRADGTVRSHSKISQTSGGLLGQLADGDNLGSSLAFLGDVDGDGIPELAAGAPLDDEAASNAGSLWLFSVSNTGSAFTSRKITSSRGGFGDVLDPGDEFGAGLAPIGDLNGDGVDDLLVGSVGDDDGGNNEGAVRTLFLGGFASAAFRGGSGVNVPCFSPVTLPIIGAQHVVRVYTFHHPGALFTVVFGYTAPSEGIVSPMFGEFLVDFTSTWIFSSLRATQGFADDHVLAIPDDISLLGFPLYCQAGVLGGGTELCNGTEVVLGY